MGRRTDARILSRTTNPHECCNCHCEVGEAARELPVRVPEDEGEGGGRIEVFCPQCFVWKRAPFDRRWEQAMKLAQFLAVKCGNCGMTSLDAGRRACGQCGSRSVVGLGPKAVVSIDLSGARRVG